MVERSNDGKVVNLFCVVGLNAYKLTKYKDEDNSLIKYVQTIDIMKKNFKINCDKFENDNVKWLILSRRNSFWLRIGYSKKYDNPITFIKVLECIIHPKNPDFILIKRSYIENGYRPIKILYDEDVDLDFPDSVCIYLFHPGIY